MTSTPLDLAFAAMQGSDADRLAFFERFADSELYLLLESTLGDQDAPRLFETSDGPLILAFDSEDRLSEFAGGPAPYAALPGRAIAEMLSGQNVGIAFNPDVAPSSMVLAPEAVAWLHNILANGPEPHKARPVSLGAPSAPARLIEGLDQKLSAAAGLADRAWLADATYQDGSTRLFLAIIAPRTGAETALARAVSEALIFSDIEDGALDVAFFDTSDEITATLARVGLGIVLPVPEVKQATIPDPDTPPRLR